MLFGESQESIMFIYPIITINVFEKYLYVILGIFFLIATANKLLKLMSWFILDIYKLKR